MNQRAAFDETVALAEQAGMPEHSPSSESLGLAHLRSMQARIVAGDFSESKLGRWLGWAQAAVVAANVGVGLEDVKQINLRHADDVPCAECGEPATYRLGMPTPAWCDRHGPRPSGAAWKVAVEPIKVTVSDPTTGEVLEERVIDNDFILLCAGNRYLDNVQAHATGTQVLTVKVNRG